MSEGTTQPVRLVVLPVPSHPLLGVRRRLESRVVAHCRRSGASSVGVPFACLRKQNQTIQTKPTEGKTNIIQNTTRHDDNNIAATTKEEKSLRSAATEPDRRCPDRFAGVFGSTEPHAVIVNSIRSSRGLSAPSPRNARMGRNGTTLSDHQTSVPVGSLVNKPMRTRREGNGGERNG